MRNSIFCYPERTAPSSWLSAVHLLLEGISKTAIGIGLLLGQVATVVERNALTLPLNTGHTYSLPVGAPNTD